MATVNLSEERAILLPEIENHRVVILVSRWNEEVTENLYNGAMETLLRLGFQLCGQVFDFMLQAEYFRIGRIRHRNECL